MINGGHSQQKWRVLNGNLNGPHGRTGLDGHIKSINKPGIEF
jgi:hypothetical protein